MLDLFGFNKPPKSLKQPKDGLERKLASSIIHQAILDACMADMGTFKVTVRRDKNGDPIEEWLEAQQRVATEEAKRARDWLLHDNHAFLFYCYSMDIEPWAVREYVHKLRDNDWVLDHKHKKGV